MKHLALFCLMLASFSLVAEISILSPTGSSNATICDGSFTVRATGTAGPFTIQILTTQNSDAITLEGVEGDFLIDGMCDGSYRVRVFPDGYLSCVKEMDVFLKGSGKAIGPMTWHHMQDGKTMQAVKENFHDTVVGKHTGGVAFTKPSSFFPDLKEFFNEL
jgi:hypothetical protein